MAVRAPNGDRRQCRQREYAGLSRGRHSAVFRRLDSSPIELATTNPAHLSLPQSEAGALREVEVDPAEQTLSGNTVNLEQQMINLGDVNRDYTMNSNIRRVFHQLLLSALK